MKPLLTAKTISPIGVLRHFGWLAILVVSLMMGWGVVDALAQGPTPQIEFVNQFNGDVREVVIQDNYAYAGIGSRLVIFDISNPVHPTIVGQTDILSRPISSIALAENKDYIVVLANELHILDISSRSAPHEIGFYETPGNEYTVVARGNYAYIADGDDLRIVNISDPAHPVEISFCYTTGWSNDVTIAGDYAYVANFYGGMDIINISNPLVPVWVGFYNASSTTRHVVVAGQYAYLANEGIGLRIVDVSNPTSPSEIGFHYTSGSTYNLAVTSNFAYLLDGPQLNLSTGELTGGGLSIVNISEPTNPAGIDFYDTPGVAYDVAVVGNYIYVADTDGGLVILWFAPPVTTSISVGEGSLTSPNDQTAYAFPSGLFTDTVIITHTARFSGKAPSSGNLVGIDHFFDVTAVYSDTVQPAQLVPGQSYTLTVQYTDAEKGPAIEDTLALYYWDGGQWVKETSSVVNTAGNTVTATPTHWANLWAVLGETRRTFLPAILRISQ